MKDNIANKTTAIAQIIEILRRETDSTHKMPQTVLQAKLDQNYNLVVNRKTIHRHLLNLQTAGFPIEFDRKGCYWDEKEDVFEESEIRLLIDSVLFSKHIPEAYANDLIGKLADLAPISFRERLKVRAESIGSRVENRGVFYNIEILGNAIAENKQIEFVQNRYDANGKIVPMGRETVVSPLKLVAYNNHYYLFAKDENGEACFFRVEKISDLKKLNAQSEYVANNKDIDDYLSTHPYMFGGEPERCRILLGKDRLDDFVDMFGTQFTCFDEKGNTIELIFHASAQDLLVWAMQNCMSVEVLEPQSVRDTLRANATALKLKYDKTAEDAYQDAIARAKQSKILYLSHFDLAYKRQYQSLTDCEQVILDDVNVTNVDFLKNFTNMWMLRIRNVDINSLQAIAGNEKLQSVLLIGTAVKDLSVLSTLPNLRDLVLGDNPNVANFDVLHNLKALEYLTIDESVPRGEGFENVRLRVMKRDEQINLDFRLDRRSPQRLISKIYNKNYITLPPVCSKAAVDEFYGFLASVLSEDQVEILKLRFQNMLPTGMVSTKMHVSNEYVNLQVDKALEVLRRPENRMKIEQIFFGKVR